MLKFFRTYQKYFFLVITIVIVISFSFFGTYDGLPQGQLHTQPAFTAVDGSTVSRQELNAMIQFLGTDSLDHQIFGGIWGPNFLNDGLIKQDFMETGMAEILARNYAGEIEKDIATRHVKEKRFSPYTHPQAKFISIENAWGYVAPSMRSNFEVLKAAQNPTSNEAIGARIALFLGEKQIPAPTLKRLIRYQEQQYEWVKPDSNLEYVDLSLFGYHTVEDWFGGRFVNFLSQFVINGAKIAEERGYEVSKKEALTDLLANAEKSYQQNLNNPRVAVANVGEYFDEQLRRMNIDRNSAVKVWRQVLLFRRLFNDVGGGVFLDPLMFEQFNAFAKQQVSGELYQLQQPLRLSRYNDLQQFEFYLDAISDRPKGGQAILQLPTSFYSAEEVTTKFPELVQKRYQLQVSSTTLEDLEAKISLKQTWNWEVDEENWDALVKEFSELGLKKGTTRDERFTALDSLDPKMRARVDVYARQQIVAAHPEWIATALKDVPSKEIDVGLRRRGGSTPFVGLKKGAELMALLDEAPIGVTTESLQQYTADKKHYYLIVVKERSSEPEIMTFLEAKDAGILSELLTRKLEAYYLDIRKEHPQVFQQGDGSWRNFSEVQNRVADYYFAPLLEAIRADYAADQTDIAENWTGEIATPFRFTAYMRTLLEAFKGDPSIIASHVITPEELSDEGFSERSNLGEQWKLLRNPYVVERNQPQRIFDPSVIFTLGDGDWSKVGSPPNGDAAFLQVGQMGEDFESSALVAQVERAQSLIAADAKQQYMRHLLNVMVEKNAIDTGAASPISAEPEIES